MDDYLQIIVPAYNEEKIIYDNLLRITKEVSEWKSDFRVIVVDDGSTDSTLVQCRRAEAYDERITVVSVNPNRGKGNAIKQGVFSAEKKGYILFIDADLDIAPSHIRKYYDLIIETDSDAVIGSKLHSESVLEYPFSRKIVSFIYYIAVRLMFGLDVHDTQTGIKIFRAEMLKPVMEHVLNRGFAFDVELLAIMKKYGAEIKEAPVEIVFQRQSPFGRIKLRDILVTFRDTIAVFIRMKIKNYYDGISLK